MLISMSLSSSRCKSQAIILFTCVTSQIDYLGADITQQTWYLLDVWKDWHKLASILAPCQLGKYITICVTLISLAFSHPVMAGVNIGSHTYNICKYSRMLARLLCIDFYQYNVGQKRRWYEFKVKSLDLVYFMQLLRYFPNNIFIFQCFVILSIFFLFCVAFFIFHWFKLFL